MRVVDGPIHDYTPEEDAARQIRVSLSAACRALYRRSTRKGREGEVRVRE